jgi:hypothetical protein
MKNSMHSYTLNLFNENRLVFMSENQETSAGKEKQALKSTINKLNTEERKTVKTATERLIKFSKYINTQLEKNPNNPKLKKTQENLKKLRDPFLGKSNANPVEIAEKIINALNKIDKENDPTYFDEKVSSTSTTGTKEKDEKPQTEAEKKKQEKEDKADIEAARKEMEAIKKTLTNTKAPKAEEKKPEPLPAQDPIVDIPADLELPNTPPILPKGLTVEKPTKTVEKDEITKVADCLKFIHKNTSKTREIPADLFKALQDFIKNIKLNSSKTFNQDGIDAKITRLPDEQYEIFTKTNEFKLTQYLTKGKNFVVGAGKGKDQFVKREQVYNDPADKKPKKNPGYTDELIPDPKTLKEIEDQERTYAENNRINEGMKPWVENIKTAVNKVVEELKGDNAGIQLAKDIQEKTAYSWKEATSLAVRFIDQMLTFRNDLVTKKDILTPTQIVERARNITRQLPSNVKAEYFKALDLKAGITQLASLKNPAPLKTEVAAIDKKPKSKI